MLLMFQFMSDKSGLGPSRHGQGIRQKKNVCFLLHLKKIRVGRSLLISFYYFFPCLHEVYNEKGSFWAIAIYLQYRMHVLL